MTLGFWIGMLVGFLPAITVVALFATFRALKLHVCPGHRAPGHGEPLNR